MLIKIVVPDKESGTLNKKEICIKSTNFNLINMLDQITDYKKVKAILKKYEDSYKEANSKEKFDIEKNFYNGYVESPKKIRRPIEVEYKEEDY